MAGPTLPVHLKEILLRCPRGSGTLHSGWKAIALETSMAREVGRKVDVFEVSLDANVYVQPHRLKPTILLQNPAAQHKLSQEQPVQHIHIDHCDYQKVDSDQQ